VSPISVAVVSDRSVFLNKDKYIQQKDKNITKFAECKACCHSISFFKNELIGDVLDIEMFKASKWIMKQKESGINEGKCVFYPNTVHENIKSGEIDIEQAYQVIPIIYFDFSSELQRMSVIAHNTFDKDYVLYTKGSPEMIESL